MTAAQMSSKFQSNRECGHLTEFHQHRAIPIMAAAAISQLVPFELHRDISEDHDGCTKIIKALEFGFDLKIDSTMVSSETHSLTEKPYVLYAVVYREDKNANIRDYVTDGFHVVYNCWIRFNNFSVKAVQEKYVLKPQETRVPYLVFYRRRYTTRSK
ncbi:ubiquitin carboxyl-terminal hydrolase 10-like [Leptinotarsa decemlineata]|uniref:ubiquitin carboxyl-terminal hydrolase 10-like n=1 Tax=Leptinotarsa decemlineata TaxID=7539 RepID=UPI003D308CD5